MSRSSTVLLTGDKDKEELLFAGNDKLQTLFHQYGEHVYWNSLAECFGPTTILLFNPDAWNDDLEDRLLTLSQLACPIRIIGPVAACKKIISHPLLQCVQCHETGNVEYWSSALLSDTSLVSFLQNSIFPLFYVKEDNVMLGIGTILISDVLCATPSINWHYQNVNQQKCVVWGLVEVIPLSDMMSDQTAPRFEQIVSSHSLVLGSSFEEEDTETSNTAIQVNLFLGLVEGLALEKKVAIFKSNIVPNLYAFLRVDKVSTNNLAVFCPYLEHQSRLQRPLSATSKGQGEEESFPSVKPDTIPGLLSKLQKYLRKRILSVSDATELADNTKRWENLLDQVRRLAKVFSLHEELVNPVCTSIKESLNSEDISQSERKILEDTLASLSASA